MMRKSWMPAGIICLAFGLTACSGGAESETSAESSIPYGRPVDFDSDSLPADFARAIENYCYDGTFPDGREAVEIPKSISYAVYDIDGDGEDELILQNTNTAMAGMLERIYAYEGGIFREELFEFPALTYYDNGIIQAEWSHNQGVSGDRIWPYNLYQYQPETDSYELLASVDGWDREVRDFTDYLGAFPDEMDADGDGFVYFLMLDGETQYNRSSIVDGPEYESWKSQYLNESEALEIPYQELEVETIYPDAQG